MAISVPTDAYAELTDVVALLPKRSYTATSMPTETQAEGHIKDVAKVIDARLRAIGYSPPLTASEDVQVLKHLNALGAAALCESATLGVVQGENPVIDSFREEYKMLLKDISDGKFQFATAGDPPVSDGDGPDDLDEQGDRADPVFENSSSERNKQF